MSRSGGRRPFKDRYGVRGLREKRVEENPHPKGKVKGERFDVLRLFYLILTFWGYIFYGTPLYLDSGV